jgi:hypothetical protein
MKEIGIMKTIQMMAGVAVLCLLTLRAGATTYFVNVSNTVPASPFATWTAAATNIQDAIDASTDGDLILVTNGLYATGGRVVYGSLTNRVVINKAVTVQSVNGPAKTFIQGYPSLGNSAVRCVYLTNNAALLGFTLTNGATRMTGDTYEEQSGGGIWCESTSAIVSNCVVAKNAARFFGGGTVSGTLKNSTLTNNTASLSTSQGGGALAGILTNCIIARNSAAFGGGAASNVLFNCTLTNNSANNSGGGAFSCVLSNCFLYGNSATNGGGAACGTLTGCTLTNNIAYNGGGSFSNTLNNCALIHNLATNSGGGAFSCTLSNCTLISNFATNYGGGAFACALSNCTLSGNSAFGSAVQSCGGGACFGMLYNCTLSNNASVHGGGTGSNTLNNCILFSNTASDGGGAFVAVLNSCILYSNTASFQGGGSYGGTLNACVINGNQSWQGGGGAENANLNDCLITHNFVTLSGASGTYYCNLTNCTVVGNATSSSIAAVGGNGSQTCANSIVYYNQYINVGGMIIINCCLSANSGVGYITNEPSFVNLDAGDYHLQSNSPCIDAGNNAYTNSITDLDGRPRVVNGTVDIGAYEYQGTNLEPFVVWLDQYGLPDDGSADYADSDGTGMKNWQKWIAGLNPTNRASVLAMLSPAATNKVTGLTVSWQSVNTRTYYLQRSTNLAASPAFSALQSNLVGQAGTTSYIDATATNRISYFYRVGVQ